MDSRKDLLLAFGIIALGIAVIAIAYSWPEPLIRDAVGPRAFPYALGLLFVFGGAFVAWQRVRAMHAAAGYVVPDEGGEEEDGVPASGLRAMTIIGLCVVYTLILNPIGFIVATPPFIALALITMKERSPVTVVATSLAFTAITYLLIHTVLGGRLPDGVLEGMLPF
jgi:putative tricarboxylic transport membrane protein